MVMPQHLTIDQFMGYCCLISSCVIARVKCYCTHALGVAHHTQCKPFLQNPTSYWSLETCAELNFPLCSSILIDPSRPNLWWGGCWKGSNVIVRPLWGAWVARPHTAELVHWSVAAHSSFQLDEQQWRYSLAVFSDYNGISHSFYLGWGPILKYKELSFSNLNTEGLSFKYLSDYYGAI